MAYPSQSVVDLVNQRRLANPPRTGEIEEVESGSLAERLGVRPGDRVLALDGRPVRDAVDFGFRTAGQAATLLLERPGAGQVTVQVPETDEPLGIGFANELFDRVITCDNNCPFCFVYQLPKRMRSSLYIKDDDFRLSFSHGNYITLTNLSAEDFARIREQRLSPMYVSVHATDPETRIHLLGGNRKGGRILEQLRELIDARIRIHCQIVFCPRINDGEILTRTLEDLAALHPGTLDIAIVPVAIGDHLKPNRQLWPVTPEVAAATLRQVRPLQRRFQRELGTPFAYLADEFYLLAGERLPGHRHYRDYALLEDGIGLVRRWLHYWTAAARRLPQRLPTPQRVALATGYLGARILEGAVRDLNKKVEGLRVDLVPIPNRYFGKAITVAGLITGSDLRQTLAPLCRNPELRPDEVWIPAVCLRDGVFLDDVSLEDLEATVGTRVVALEETPQAVRQRVRRMAG